MVVAWPLRIRSWSIGCQITNQNVMRPCYLRCYQSTLNWKLLYPEFMKFLTPLWLELAPVFVPSYERKRVGRRQKAYRSSDWAISEMWSLSCKFTEEFKTKESRYVHRLHIYVHKKRLFIQKCICAVYLWLKLCLVNCFIKKLTRYKFDWSAMTGSIRRHTYINFYVLICTYMQTKLSTSKPSLHIWIKNIVFKTKEKRKMYIIGLEPENFMNAGYDSFQFTVIPSN